MRLLAIETATRAGSWALIEDGDVTAAGAGDASVTLDVQLPGSAIAMLASRGFSPADMDFFAVASGPGSFTGLRVGIATVQGFAMATGRLTVPIPTLDAIAAGAATDAAGSEYIAAWLDGQRREIFAGLYALRETETPRLLMPPQVGPPSLIGAGIANLAGGARVTFAGDAAHRYRDIVEQLGLREPRLAPVTAIAPHVARLAALRTDTAVRPHAIVPAYVRRPDVELARERRA